MSWGYFDSETLRMLVLQVFKEQLASMRRQTPNPIPSTTWDRLQTAVSNVAKRMDLYPTREECPAGVDFQLGYAAKQLNPVDYRTLMSVTWALIFEGVLSPGATAKESSRSGWPFLELSLPE